MTLVSKDINDAECFDRIAHGTGDTGTWHDRDEELAALAKAIAHPVRVRILRLLIAEGPGRCICGDICRQIPLAQSTVSQHLKVLKDAGVICGEVDGPRICYSVNTRRLWRLCELVSALQTLPVASESS